MSEKQESPHEEAVTPVDTQENKPGKESGSPDSGDNGVVASAPEASEREAAAPQSATPENAPDAARPQESAKEASEREEAADIREEETKNEPEDGKVNLDKSFDDVEEDSPDSSMKSEEEKSAQPKYGIGAWGKLFNSLSRGGPIMLLVGLCALVWPDFTNALNGLYCPGEVTPISAFLQCVAKDSWLMPVALDNGAFTLPQWPGFFWLLALLAYIPGLVSSGYLLPLSSTIAACLALLGAWGMAHAAKAGGRAAFAAGLVLFCAPLFIPITHFVGAPPLAAACVLVSLAFFARGWQKNHAFISIPLGFVFAGLAGLTAGWLFLALPLVASFCFLIWRGTIKRAQALDALFGFILLLAMYGIWFGAIMLGHNENNDYLAKLAANTWTFENIAGRWWIYLIPVIGTMPWILTIFGVSWFRVLGHAPKTLSASRKSNAFALIWIALILAACMTLVLPVPQHGAIMMVMIASVLLGKAFVNMKPGGNRFFFFLASLALIIIGLLMEAASFEPSQKFILGMAPIPVEPRIPQILAGLGALPIIGGVFILAGLLGFFFVRRYRGDGGIIYGSIIAIIISNLFLFLLIPQVGSLPDTPLVTLAGIEKQVQGAQLAVPSQVPASEIQTPAVPEQQNNLPIVPRLPEEVTAPAPSEELQAREQATPPPARDESAPIPGPAPAIQGQEAPAQVPQPDKQEQEAPVKAQPLIIIEETPAAPKGQTPEAPIVEEKKEVIVIPETPASPPVVVPVPEPVPAPAQPEVQGTN